MQQISSRPRGSVRTQQGPVWAFLMHRVINPLMRRLLASRWHARMGSDTLMLLTFHGRKSGKSYTFPIGYKQEGAQLISYSPFAWWTNLQGGAPVTVTLHGQRIAGTAEVRTETATIASGMADYLRHNPGDAKYFYVKLDRDGQPVAEDLERAAHKNVQIRVALAAGSTR
jgi:hypothetical protein